MDEHPQIRRVIDVGGYALRCFLWWDTVSEGMEKVFRGLRGRWRKGWEVGGEIHTLAEPGVCCLG